MSDETLFKEVIRLSIDVAQMQKETTDAVTAYISGLKQMRDEHGRFMAGRKDAVNALAIAEQRINDEATAKYLSNVEHRLRQERGMQNKFDDEAKAAVVARENFEFARVEEIMQRRKAAYAAEQEAEVFINKEAVAQKLAAQQKLVSERAAMLGAWQPSASTAGNESAKAGAAGGGFGRNLTKFAAGAFLIEQIAGMATAAIKPVLELGDGLASMATLFSSATKNGEDFAHVLDSTAKAAAELSFKFDVSIIDVVNGFKDALSAGINEGELSNFMDKAGTLATALGVNLKQSVDILTDIQGAYHLAVGDMTHVSDVLFNLVNVGKVNVSELSQSFGRLLPIAKAAGVSLEDAAAGVATLTRQGMTNSQAVTGMAQLIERIINPSKKAAKEFHKLGIAYGQAAVSGKDLVDIIGNIESKTGGNLDVLDKLFPEERALRAIAALSQTKGMLEENRKAMDEVGTATQASSVAMDTFGHSVGRVIEASKNKFLELGNAIGSALKPLVDLDIFNRRENDRKEASRNDSLEQNLDKYSPAANMSARANYLSSSDAADKESHDNLEKLRKDAERSENAELGRRGTKDQRDILKEMENQLAVLQLQKAETEAIARIERDRINAATKKKVDEAQAKYAEDRNWIQNGGAYTTMEGQIKAATKLDTAYEEKIDTINRSNRSAEHEIEVIAKAKKGYDLLGDAVEQQEKKIAAARTALLTGPTSDALHQQMEEEKKEVKLLDARHREFAQRSKQIENETYAEFRRLYNADKAAFERAQREKQNALKRINKEMESAQAAHTASLARINDQLLHAKMSSASGDIGAQRRIQGQAKAQAESALNSFLSAGNGDRKEFDTLLGEFEKATQALTQLAEEDNKGSGRRKADDFASMASEFENRFSNSKLGVLSQQQSDASIRAAKSNLPSLDSIAAQAAKNVSEKHIVEKRLIKTRVEVQVDGSLSDQTKKDLAEAIITQIHIEDKNQTGNNPVPQESYDGDVSGQDEP